MIRKLQCAGICGKLKRRNKLWSCDKLSNNNLDNETDYGYLCGGNNMLNYLCLSCLNHELNQEKRADRHYTDNQDYNDFNNNRLGGARSLVRIQLPRQEEKH